MKHLISGASAAVLAAVTMTAQAELSGNVGWDSEYIFRGVPQSDSSPNGGIDWAEGIGDSDLGVYLGTWAADVDEGLEIDYYGGVTAEVGDFNFLAGFTYYDYTDNFDDTYKEVNLGADWQFISFAAALGEYDNFDGPTQDYQYYELTLSHNGFFGTIGSFHDDFDGEFVQLGYGTTIVGVDVTASWIYSNSDLVDGIPALDNRGEDIDGSDQSIVVQVSKSFSFEQLANAWRGLQ
jgi:uncharacterized protein (TIGR02001 family)